MINIGSSIFLRAAQILSLSFVSSMSPGEEKREVHLGICIEGGPKLEACHIHELKTMGTTHISLNPFGFIKNPHDPRIRLSTKENRSPEWRWWGEGDAGIAQYSRMAQDSGIKVMLRPHIWIGDPWSDIYQQKVWLSSVDFQSEEEWKTFEDSYRIFALHYAQLAQDNNIQWYSIGAEMTRTTQLRPDYWKRLIKEVRDIYDGKLVYSAEHWEELETISFWSELDAIGIQAYFPLTEEENPNLEELVEAWQPHIEKIRDISLRENKPVIYTEIGYKSTADAAIAPWEWESSAEVDEELQERCYEAAIRAAVQAGVVDGIYWWKYHVEPCNEAGQISLKPRPKSFTFQGKRATETLTKYYNTLIREDGK